MAFAVDASRSVVAWSRGATRTTGLAPEEMIGRHCLKGIHTPDCLGECRLQQSSAPRADRVQLVTSEGGLRWYRRHLFPVRDGEGDFLGGIEILRPAGVQQQVRQDEGVRLGGLISQDPAVRAVLRRARALAATPLPIHIVGEVGTPRLALARRIHEEASPGREMQWVHGARLSTAHLRPDPTLATLYVEDVSRADPDVQAVLASRLQAPGEPPRGPRFITSGLREPQAEVRAERMLPELRIALGTTTLELPPLREREGDVEGMVHRVLHELNQGSERAVAEVDDDAMQTLCAYSWPGNDAELRAVVEYAHRVGVGPVLRQDDLLSALQEEVEAPTPFADLDQDERREAERVRQAIRDASGNLGRAAELLGVSRTTLWRKRKKYGL